MSSRDWMVPSNTSGSPAVFIAMAQRSATSWQRKDEILVRCCKREICGSRLLECNLCIRVFRWNKVGQDGSANMAVRSNGVELRGLSLRVALSSSLYRELARQYRNRNSNERTQLSTPKQRRS